MRVHPTWLIFFLGLLPLAGFYEALKQSLSTSVFLALAIVYLLLLGLVANRLGARIVRRRAERRQGRPPTTLHSLALPALVFSMALPAGWLAGFGGFLTKLPPPRGVPADAACVAVASGEHDRLLTAITQYAGRAEIFVSGATEGTNHLERDDMRSRAPDWFDGHVAFGWEARNTRENGYEISSWAAARDCPKLVLLSDDTHLPRLSLAVRRAGFDGPLDLHAVGRFADAGTTLAHRLRLAARAWSRYVWALIADW